MDIRTVMLVSTAAVVGAIGGSASLLLAQSPVPPTETIMDVFDEPCLARRAADIINSGTPSSPQSTNAFSARTTSTGPQLLTLLYPSGTYPAYLPGPPQMVSIATPDGIFASQLSPTDVHDWLLCGQYATGSTRGNCGQVQGEALAVEASLSALGRARILSASENKCMVRINAAGFIGQNLATSKGKLEESVALLQQIRTAALLSEETLKVLKEIRDNRPQPSTASVGGLAPVTP